MRVFFSAGEASGDAYAAELARAFVAEGVIDPDEVARKLVEGCVADARGYVEGDGEPGIDDLRAGLRAWHPEFLPVVEGAQTLAEAEAALAAASRCGHGPLWGADDTGAVGVGARRSRDAGIRLIADSSPWGAIGILESLKVVPRVWGGYHRALRELRSGTPGLFVPIDFGYVNVRLAREAKRRAWRVLYFSPPGSWRRDKQGADLPAVTDAIVTPFPWSRDLLRAAGADAHFFGHPLQAMVARVPDPPERTGVAVLPGSREHEVLRNLEVILPAVQRTGGPVHFAVAPTLDGTALLEAWHRAGGPPAQAYDGAAPALKAARAAVVCSGTATLEAALCGCPTVVVYRGSKLMELEFRLRKPRFEYVSLPNILLRRPLVPELLQWEATSDRIEAELSPLLVDGSEREAQLAGFRELALDLGGPECFRQTADLARRLTRP